MSNASSPALITIGADQAADGGDAEFDAAGSPIMNAGLAQYYARIGRLLAAQHILGSPGLGAGLGQYIGQPFTVLLEQQALADAQAAILSDALTSDIASLSLSMPHQSQLQLAASIFLVGQPAGSPPVSLIWIVTP